MSTTKQAGVCLNWSLLKITNGVERVIAQSNDVAMLKARRDDLHGAEADGKFHPYMVPAHYAVFSAEAMTLPYLQRLSVGAKVSPLPECADVPCDDWREGLKGLSASSYDPEFSGAEDLSGNNQDWL